ncbi:hypothetical protein FOXB_05055 [Fusarium oxysporum f. sp. conglutinans Fo5176]|uniref:Uncharacterized protein n=1 Tax=Fusarium oxysporum (strain Fo5176) TaxID=660025 RepID=F9FF76_FUSOF|nr:hypothetical protein FOXB_05055 [Fusarium oxysporum f. sp. conglutinans Fo5176]
MAATNVIR